MNPCVKSSMPQGLAWLTLSATLLLAACGGGGNTRPGPSQPAPTTPAAETPAAAVPDKGDPDERFKAALALMKSKKTADAEAAFLKLAQDFPDYTGPQTNLGILYAKSNRRDVAISAFNKAASANPQNVAALNWLGILYRETGNYPNARQAYEKALQVKPDYPAAHLNLGILLDEYMKQPAEALPHYKLYLQQHGKEDLRVLAWIAEIEAAQKAATPATTAAPAAQGTP